MLKIKTLLLVLLPIVINAQVYESTWQSKKVIPDGNLSEWDLRPNHFDAKSSVLYGYRNDSSNIYLAVEIADKAMQMKAIGVGFKIKFNVKSKPKTIATISFPVSLRNKDKGEKNERPDPKELQKNYKLQNAPALTEGFKNTKGSLYSNKTDLNHISYGVDWDDYGAMIFELAIPFNELFNDECNLTTISKTIIALELKFDAAQQPSNGMQAGMGAPGGGGRGMGGPPGGGGGRGGGQHSGGNMQNQNGDMQSKMMLMSSEQKIKSKFTIKL